MEQGKKRLVTIATIFVDTTVAEPMKTVGT